jgi:uncharacterized protein (DUF362 family)
MVDDERTHPREVMRRTLIGGGLGVALGAGGYWLARRDRTVHEPALLRPRAAVPVPDDPRFPQLVVARGEDPRRLVRSCLDALGGMERFIARGDVVVVKPNAAWDRTPRQAATTNPDVLAELAWLCLDAGAKQVTVTDVTINDARRCFERSGIAAAASAAGARVVLPESRLFRETDLRGEVLRVWPVLEPFLTADKVINVPVAKHHSLTGVTLGMKNWYGILGGARQRLHQRIHESLADLAAFLRPTLTVIDCWRVLLRNGPGGGNLEDVLTAKTLVAGTDPVALDAWAAREFWKLEPSALPYLALAHDRGLGTFDLESVRTRLIPA